MTLAQSALGDLVGPRQRGRYQGLFSSAMSVSTVVGPLLGGLLLAITSWRWIFLASLPIGILALVLIFAALPSGRGTREHRVDVASVIFWIVAAASGLLFLSTIGSTGGTSGLFLLATCATAVIFTGLFLRRELHAPEPILSLSLFRIPSFAVAVTAAALMTFAMHAATVFLPLYFQTVLGQRPEISGMMLLPQVSGMIVSATVGGRFSARTGEFKHYLLVGVSLEATALALLVLCALMNAGPGPFMIALLVLGLGTGLGMPNAIVIVQNAVPREMLGAATGTMSCLRSLGGAFGVALSGCVMQSWLGFGSSAPSLDHLTGVDQGLRSAVEALRIGIASSFGCGAVVMIAALLACTRLPARDVRDGSSRLRMPA